MPSAAAFPPPIFAVSKQPRTRKSHGEISTIRFRIPSKTIFAITSSTEQILYIVTTAGVPLKVRGSGGLTGDAASVDSELTLLYFDLHGRSHALAAGIANPFFGKTGVPFRHPDFPIYLVTRLAGYDFDDAKAIVDRALLAHDQENS